MKQEGSPFEIRAHHFWAGPLGANDELFKSGKPSINQIVDLVKCDVNSMLGSKLSFDYIGSNPWEYARRSQLMIMRFCSLPDNYPVEITQTPDEICRTCIVGQHCRTQDIVDEDREAMDDFLACATWSGLKEGKDYLLTTEPTGIRRISIVKEIYLRVVNTYTDYLSVLYPEDAEEN